ncbi:nitronate monooxygenase [Aeromicrobium sp. IC_218]|uniref:NAD(P)H-dependent flavin oxidoreductase n=1 Tax=Aeromicrobium sp. IC_218 TaxID=2545468 RepID=UPI00103A0611|nr:nitronate monooxygenase [Aeromicrobium sp. IC_218]TCI98845.1 nitronate monooxygenase [Aeromicrobium sp. IC_218]
MTLLGTDLPLVGAPMAGGTTTVDLAAAVTGAGGIGLLAAGYRTPEDLAAQVAALRERTDAVGVNLFVPSDERPDVAEVRAYAERLRPEADALGVTLTDPPLVDDDHWDAKVDLLVSDPVPFVSLTFGLPPAADVRRLQQAGTRVLATVTTADEAREAEELGVDGLVVQGPSAGGHSATFDPRRTIEDVPTADVVRAVGAATRLPLVAAGGVAGPADVRALLEAGVEAVQVGTLLLRSDESGAGPTHREALTDPRFTETVVTHAFTGRPARALRNAFADRHGATAPVGYPAVHHLTRELRATAARQGDAEHVHLWAGTGYRHAPTGPAADVVRALSRDL